MTFSSAQKAFLEKKRKINILVKVKTKYTQASKVCVFRFPMIKKVILNLDSLSKKKETDDFIRKLKITILASDGRAIQFK